MLQRDKENIECCDLNIIISDFYNHLKNYLTGKIKNNELAEDIVQEVMLKLVTAHQKNLKVQNLKAWLYQIARNTLIDYYRKNANVIQENEENLKDSLYSLQEESFRPSDYLIPMINLGIVALCFQFEHQVTCPYPLPGFAHCCCRFCRPVWSFLSDFTTVLYSYLRSFFF